MTPHTDPNWMLLFIDSDCNSSTGWNGYDYLVNSPVVDANTTTLKRTPAGWNWTTVTQRHFLSGLRQQDGDSHPASGYWPGRRKAQTFTRLPLGGQHPEERRHHRVLRQRRQRAGQKVQLSLQHGPRPGSRLHRHTRCRQGHAQLDQPIGLRICRGLLIRCKTGSYPASPTDGATLVDKTPVPGAAETSCTRGFDNITYYYTAFVYDRLSSCSSAQASGDSALLLQRLSESFDSYSDGSLGGQGSWTTTGAASAQVQSAYAKGGTGKSR